MRLARLPLKWIVAIISLTATAIVVSGCGGGGGGGGNSGSGGSGSGGLATTYSFQGIVESTTNGSPLSGAVVSLDGSNTYVSTATGSNGTWSINDVPQSFISASSSHIFVTTVDQTVTNTTVPSTDYSTPGTVTGIILTSSTPPAPPQ